MDLDKAIGFESEPAPTAWVQRDILLYATGVSTLAPGLAAPCGELTR